MTRPFARDAIQLSPEAILCRSCALELLYDFARAFHDYLNHSELLSCELYPCLIA